MQAHNTVVYINTKSLAVVTYVWAPSGGGS